MHVVLTDSGLGGLAVCAGLEAECRRHGLAPGLRLTFVNAWPEESRGYNDFADDGSRAAVFDRVLVAVDAMAPDLVVIACNTLSILHGHTAHCRSAPVPVVGIVEAGVTMFADALSANAGAALVLIGTRTTVGSGVHVARLEQRGVPRGRVSAAACHGLATAIENGPVSVRTASLIGAAAAAAAEAAPAGDPLLLGLCCTHYGFVAERVRDALAQRTRRHVEVLDPNERLVHDLVPRVEAAPPGAKGPAGTPIPVRMISKVTLSASKREQVAALLDARSPATANALRDCVQVPDLF